MITKMFHIELSSFILMDFLIKKSLVKIGDLIIE